MGSSFFFLFRLIWPFLKELTLGNLTLREGIRTKRRSVVLLLFISVLIGSLFFIVPKFIQLSQEHTKLLNSIEARNVNSLEASNNQLEDEVIRLRDRLSLDCPSSATPKPEQSVTQSVVIPTPHVEGVKTSPNGATIIVLPQQPKQIAPVRKVNSSVEDRHRKSFVDYFDNQDAP